MKIVVIGGSGVIGSKLVPKLREQGHEAIAASPNSGVNTITEGLAEALNGVSVVVVSNAPSWEDAAVMKFCETSTRNVLSKRNGRRRETSRCAVSGRDRTDARASCRILEWLKLVADHTAQRGDSAQTSHPFCTFMTMRVTSSRCRWPFRER